MIRRSDERDRGTKGKTKLLSLKLRKIRQYLNICKPSIFPANNNKWKADTLYQQELPMYENSFPIQFSTNTSYLFKYKLSLCIDFYQPFKISYNESVTNQACD